MGSKKEDKKHIRKITRVGNGDSVSLTLPIAIARKLKLKKRTEGSCKVRR